MRAVEHFPPLSDGTPWDRRASSRGSRLLKLLPAVFWNAALSREGVVSIRNLHSSQVLVLLLLRPWPKTGQKYSCL